jgi:hypothetical protein
MPVSVDVVKKVLFYGKQALELAVAVVPEGKVKDNLVKLEKVVNDPSVDELVVVGFKVYDKVKEVFFK